MTVYDYTFTAGLPLMDNLFARLDDLPFAPLVAWSLQDGQQAAMGLGDLLLLTVFLLVMRNAYGKPAGLSMLGLTAVAIAGVMLSFLSGIWQITFPLMIVLGPLMVGQYLFFRRRAATKPTKEDNHACIQTYAHHANLGGANGGPG